MNTLHSIPAHGPHPRVGLHCDPHVCCSLGLSACSVAVFADGLVDAQVKKRSWDRRPRETRVEQKDSVRTWRREPSLSPETSDAPRA